MLSLPQVLTNITMCSLKDINIIVVLILSVWLNQICCYNIFNSDVLNMKTIQISYKQSEKDVNKCIIKSVLPLLENKDKEMIRKIEFIRETNSSELEEAIIANFPKLEKIILIGNNITQISTGAFTNLPSLKYILLGDNEISSIEFNMFIETPRVLQVHLDKNKLTRFEQAWLGYIPTLEWLNLEYNFIQTITVGKFSNFPNLIYINLGHNHIEHFDEDSFYGLNQLEILDLSYNKIKELPDDLFISPSSLKVLNLFYNELSYVSNKILENLTQLRELITLFNPWQCGCYKLIETWAKSKSIRLNKQKYFKCGKAEDISDIPKSSCSQNHDCNNEVIECVTRETENLCDKLYLNHDDFECEFQYEQYIQIR